MRPTLAGRNRRWVEPIAWSFEGLLGRFIGKEGGSSEGKKDVFLVAGKRMLLRLRQCLSEGHPCKMKSHQKLFPSYPHQPLFALLLGAGFLIGGLSQSQRLHGEILVHDTFDRGPGALLNQSEAGWLHTSGTEGDLQQAQGWLQLSSKQSEDVAIALGDRHFDDASEDLLYLMMTLKVTEQPSKAGTYFAHFRGGGSSTYRGRLFVAAEEEGEGFRLGVANGASKSSEVTWWPEPFALNEPLQVVMSYHARSGLSRLGLNPAQETDLTLLAEDVAIPRGIHQFAFRQASGLGGIWVDQLTVTDDFGDLPRQTASVIPTFQIRPLTNDFPEGAGSAAWFEWERGGDLTHPIHLQVLWSGTADPEEDFMVSEASWVLASGQSHGRVYLETMKDRLVEGDEVLIAEVRAFAGEALLGDATLEGRIMDDDTLSLAQVGGIHWQHADTENPTVAIDVVGSKGDFYKIESSVDLVTWEPRETGVLTEPSHTLSWTLDRDQPAQFFRAGAATE